MGGSLGLALKARAASVEVCGYTRSAGRGRLALKRKAIDRLARTPVEAVEGADVVVLCAPVMALAEQLRSCRPGLRPGVVLTDVGSTKQHVCHELAPIAAEAGAQFVGSHPICGSEQQGMEAACADLYGGATVVVTPVADSAASAVRLVKALWRKVGGRVVVCSPVEHDRLLARTSHLPHMAAALVALTTGRTGAQSQVARYCGSGFADTTRVAEGDPGIWIDIARTNRANLAEELRALKGQTERLIAMLDDGDFDEVQRWLARGQAVRRALAGKRINERTV